MEFRTATQKTHLYHGYMRICLGMALMSGYFGGSIQMHHAIAAGPSAIQKPKIMVLNFLPVGNAGKNKNTDSAEEDLLAYLTEKTREVVTGTLSGQMEIFDPSVIPAAQATACINAASCDLEIFDAIGADYGITGEYRRIGTIRSVMLKIYHVHEGRILAQKEIKGKKDEELIESIQPAVAELLQNIKIASVQTPDSGKNTSSTSKTPTPEPPSKNGLEWIPLEGGTFYFGCNADEGGVGNVFCPRELKAVQPFSILKTEVTVTQYRACVKAGICSAPDSVNQQKNCNDGYLDRLDHPINCVDWTQAGAYCKSIGGRLPTAYEWEYAAKSGKDQKFAWGNAPADCEHAVIDSNTSAGVCKPEHTSPVCSKPKGHSEQGVCDLAGNVWEWTADLYGFTMEIRGGGWYFYPSGIRASDRTGLVLLTRSDVLGFRCVK